MNLLNIIKNGIIKENATFVLLLGMCPTLATTTSATNGLMMGLATMAVLICTNFVISCIKNITPDKVRILQDADDIYIRGLRDYKVRLSGEEARRVLAAGVPAAMTDGEIEVSLYDQVW